MHGYVVCTLLSLYDRFEAAYSMSFLQNALKQPLLLLEVNQIFIFVAAVRHQSNVVHYIAELIFKLKFMSGNSDLVFILRQREEVG